MRISDWSSDVCSSDLLGYVVDSHNEPEVALRSFTADPAAWDLVITDRSMPKMTGEDLTRSLKDVRSDVPILMLSGYVSGEDAGELSDIGLEAVIGKPVLPDELAAAVRAAQIGRASCRERVCQYV